ncbi:FliM/FliN family flagellar motor switch protein [Noviherbaspirillum galbum]|uniref:FliM/FliN family flagellar motor switch protein n=1 Tax=Noviherbaspirillum galbum TaxID=2709383 RepID=A0A6B3SQJ8_9BURK|nr:FliM/FliN family flagellar motor C-terminal domain-containing protein [Noviherbaspirillum galbum]NEX63033.1 FliM/FliN family flagellar motor switch protein [Noviherbaspirillum galbum]
MTCRPFLLLGKGALRAVNDRIEGIVRSWCDDWGIAHHSMAVLCERAWEVSTGLPGQGWEAADTRLPGAARVHASPDAASALRGLLFGEDAIDPVVASVADVAEDLASQVAREAARDLGRRLGGGQHACERLVPCDAPGRCPHASGDVLARIILGEADGHHAASWLVLLPAGQLDALLGRDPPIAAPGAGGKAPALESFSSAPVPLPVRISEFEIDLGNLASLSVDDVIRLPRQAAQPLDVLAADGEILCGAYLGKVDGQMAIEIASLITPSITNGNDAGHGNPARKGN